MQSMPAPMRPFGPFNGVVEDVVKGRVQIAMTSGCRLIRKGEK
jgi:hypothetical protein